jgi:hypothetical protein
MGEYEYQLVQEIKALRSDIQKLPDEFVTKLAKAIDRELRPFFYTGVNPVAETRKLRTGYHSLTGNCQRSCSSAYWSRLVKRRRALLESNPPRNSQLETHRGR